MEISDIISIPNVPADTTTGELMMALFSVIIDSERCDNDIVWEFWKMTTLHPFMISALAVFRDSSSNKISLSNVNGALKAKLDEIMFDAPFESADREGSGTDVSCLYDRNVPPICRFSRICPDIDAIQSGLFSIMTRNIRNRTREWNASGAISYMMLSGKGFFRCDDDGEQFVNLPDGLAWDGTMILVSIPLKQRAGFNVYNYIE